MTDIPHMLYKTKEGNTVKTVAPMVRNAADKHELVVGVVYNPEGLPVGLLLCMMVKEVPSAEWEPLQPL